MALTRCPECRKNQRIRSILSKLWVLFKKEDLEIYKQKLEQRRQQNAEINRKSTKLPPYLVGYFTIVILLASWLTGGIKSAVKNNQNFDRTLSLLLSYRLIFYFI